MTKILTSFIAVAFSLFHLYTGFFGILPEFRQRVVHLTFGLVLTFLLFPWKNLPEKTRSFLSWALMLASGGVGLYLFFNYERLEISAGFVTSMDCWIGSLLIALVIIASQRILGWALSIISLVFIFYAFSGPYLPGFLAHKGFDLDRVIHQMALGLEGIMGVAIAVSSTYLILFLLFGYFLQEVGKGFFLDIAQGLFGWTRGGPAKMAVISDALFGMISGTASGGVATTGLITIPLMKKSGYRPEVAAAISATASTGGQIMPPVMGVAAFLMAELLGISYGEICLYAIFPALLFYVSLFAYVDFEAAKMGMRGLPKDQLASVRETVKAGGHLIIPVVILVYTLFVIQYSPIKSGFWAAISVIIISALKHSTRLNFRQVIDLLDKGARSAIPVVMACAIMGILIGLFGLTGLGIRFSSLILDFSLGSLLPLLILTMGASLLLGMGMPTLACYIFLVITMAPAMIQMGVSPLAAHFFIFYFGIFSAITPPVAMAAYVGAGIAEASFMKTGFVSFRMSLVAFLLPYMFIYSPAIMLHGPFFEVLMAVISAVAGVYSLAAALQGYGLTKIGVIPRLILLLASILLITPGLITDLLGFGLIGVVFIRQILSRKMILKNELVAVKNQQRKEKTR